MQNNRIITFAEAIKESIYTSLERDKSIFLMGEGVDDPSSMWGTIKGVKKKFGSKRVLEMPVSENAMIGLAVGSAIMGSKPIINLQRVEFAFLALEQIFNNAAKSFYVTNGKLKVPLVIRLVIGRGWGQGPQHSQSLETVFSYFPGLKVVMPCFPHEAKGLLTASIEDKNPVVFLEHRWLHNSVGDVPAGYYKLDLNSAEKINNGEDVTVVSTSFSTLEALKVVNFLKSHSINCDLFNLRVLNPLNIDNINKSVNKTGKILTIDTGYKKLGIGSEILSRIIENNAFSTLKAARLGLPDHPTPSSRGLIKNYYPSSMEILKKIINLINLSELKKRELLKLFSKIDNQNKYIDIPDPSFKGPF
jgi:acetoin:2,6-dichlorophenolindophenol oxidoreductase subunit beta